MLGIEGLKPAAPWDVGGRRGPADDELVARAAARVRAGHGTEGPALDDEALTLASRMLVERGRPEVPVDWPLGHEPHRLERRCPLAFGRPSGVGRPRPPPPPPRPRPRAP